MSGAATEFIIVPPQGKQAAVQRAKSRLLEHLASQFPEFGFSLATTVLLEPEHLIAGDISDRFQVFPMMGRVGGGWQRREDMVSYPSSAIMRQVQDAVEDFDLRAFALN